MRKIPKQLQVVNKERFVQEMNRSKKNQQTMDDGVKGRKARSWQESGSENPTKKPTRW